MMKLVMDAMEELSAETEGAFRADSKLADKVNDVADAARELAKEYGRKVTVDELSEEKGISLKKIKEAIRLSANKIEDIEYKDEDA